MHLLPTRRRFLACFVACLVPALSQAAPSRPPKEFAFTLGEFSHLLLTTDNQGYRLCQVTIGFDGEQQRTSFTGFKLLNSSAAEVVLEQRYDYNYPEKPCPFIRLAIKRDDKPGKPTFLSINHGPWVMTITGSGQRFESMKALLLKSRAKGLWEPKTSMIFKGEPALKDWDADFLHR